MHLIFFPVTFVVVAVAPKVLALSLAQTHIFKALGRHTMQLPVRYLHASVGHTVSSQA